VAGDGATDLRGRAAAALDAYADRRPFRGDRRDSLHRGAGRRHGGVHRRRRVPGRDPLFRHHRPPRADPRTASGRALLLQYSPEERDSVYRKIEFKQYGPSTPISIEAVEAELRNSIERGYCQSFADYSRDLAGAAIPLPIGDRRLSVVVAGPEFRIGPKVAEVASLIARTVAGGAGVVRIAVEMSAW